MIINKTECVKDIIKSLCQNEFQDVAWASCPCNRGQDARDTIQFILFRGGFLLRGSLVFLLFFHSRGLCDKI